MSAFLNFLYCLKQKAAPKLALLFVESIEF